MIRLTGEIVLFVSKTKGAPGHVVVEPNSSRYVFTLCGEAWHGVLPYFTLPKTLCRACEVRANLMEGRDVQQV